MGIICWGNLAKSADDVTRVEQAIQDYIEDHDWNPNAHMGDDYALGVHRLQTVMDHLPSSVYPEHLNPDISNIVRKKQVSDVALIEDEWVSVPSLYYHFQSSKLGSMMILVKCTLHSIDGGGIGYIRIKITKDEDVSYVPYVDGELVVGTYYIVVDGRVEVYFPYVINLYEGEYELQVQFFVDSPIGDYEVEANHTWQQNSMNIMTVGSEIKEL